MNVARSTLIYDGECSFCVRCVEWLKRITKDQVECLSFQSLRERFPEIFIKDCERSIYWIDLKENLFEGAEAIFRTLACVTGKTWLLWIYEKIPGFALIAACVCQIVSKNRKLFGSTC